MSKIQELNNEVSRLRHELAIAEDKVKQKELEIEKETVFKNLNLKVEFDKHYETGKEVLRFKQVNNPTSLQLTSLSQKDIIDLRDFINRGIERGNLHV